MLVLARGPRIVTASAHGCDVTADAYCVYDGGMHGCGASRARLCGGCESQRR